VDTVRGKDGRTYPARTATRAERARAIVLAHNLCHRDRMSIRLAQQVMLSSYGCRRSVGAIARDLQMYTCPKCEDRP
jgi:hypothetical protein